MAAVANDLSGPVYRVDTASDGSLLRSLSFSFRMMGVRWVGATTAGHAATIEDGNCHTMWSSVANASNYVEADAPRIPAFSGLKVPRLDSGTLFIEMGAG